MGHHDAILILIAGVLLAAGIAGALLADRVRVPALRCIGCVASIAFNG